MKSSFVSLNIMFLSGMLIHISLYAQKPETNIWPGFRGVNCAGVASPDQNPPVVFGKEQNVIWKLTLSEGHSSPCIWGDNIFLTGFDLEGKKLKTYCIDRKKGNIKWEKDITVENFEEAHQVSNPATATPATDGQRVYIYFSSFGLVCYDIDGEMKWEIKMPVPKSRNGMGTSPVVTGDLVILNCLGNQNDPGILAINKLNGGIVWKYSLQLKKAYGGDSFSTPVVYKNQVIIYASEDVSGYDLKTGKSVWSFPIGVTQAVCTPVLGNGILYTTTFSTYGNPVMRLQFPAFTEVLKTYDANDDDKLNKQEVKDYNFLIYPEMPEISEKYDKGSVAESFGTWDANKDGTIDSTEWTRMDKYLASFSNKIGLRAIKPGGQGDVSLSNLLWENPELPPQVASPLYYKEHVYTIKEGGLLSCFDAETGKVVYRERLSAGGAYFASPLAAAGRIYIASRNGIVTVVEAGDKMKILAKNNLGELITATPALVDNKIYLRTDKALYTFGK